MGNDRNTGKRCEIYSKLTIKKPGQHHCCRSGVLFISFE